MDINELVEEAGTNSRDHGFHDSWPKRLPVDYAPHEEEAYQRQLSLAITEKLALIHEEISEALGEIRSGNAADRVYYRDTKGRNGEPGDVFWEQHFEPDEKKDVPIFKPEGFGIELADAAIRIADLAFLLGLDLDALIEEKHEYNRTRPYKHGKKF